MHLFWEYNPRDNHGESKISPLHPFIPKSVILRRAHCRESVMTRATLVERHSGYSRSPRRIFSRSAEKTALQLM